MQAVGPRRPKMNFDEVLQHNVIEPIETRYAALVRATAVLATMATPKT